MCGIAGIINFDAGRPVDEARLLRMRDVLHHRGPDGEGLWIEGPAGLAHRRLSIVDIAGGAQPMTTDGNAWITFNGEIYNHPELKRELEGRRHQYRTRSDTETILHIYKEEGEAGVERLRGMFAFALWDRARQQVLLVRDRLGIKPLYYAVTGEHLLFASEIKAILASGLIRPALNEAVVPEYLANGFVAGTETFFRGIRKLLPGRTLTWSRRDGFRERRYWNLPEASTHASSRPLKQQASELRDRLSDAVRSHLMSDVPVGLFLSGGIDSTGLGALMAPMVNEPVKTFSVGFPEAEGNELAYARLAARSIGSDHREIVITGDDFFRELPRLVWHEDEPIAFPSSVPLHFVSALAREHVKVVLTGEGADELFGGYNRYRVSAWNQRLGSTYSRIVPKFARSTVAATISKLPWPARRYLGRTFLTLEPGVRSVFFENFAFFNQRLRDSLLSTPAARDPFEDALACYEAASGSMLDRMTQADLQTYLVELLMKQDQMSMAASVESRVPFLDHLLAEHVIGLPAESKVRRWQTKLVLREALRDIIPAEILTRRKMGFPVPVGSWLRNSFGTLVDEFVTSPRAEARSLFDSNAVRQLAAEHRSGQLPHGTKLWLLLNLEIWQRIFIDGDDIASVMSSAVRRAA
ncbi:MAG TPA: asparagine synthase (glutamine-hydrolyzing) [Thermoanaerobaculia bacterium]|nr:asparagine synthase (glutamine-hydrolyzing) [Thermoanaerobaculia bacterium]